MKLELPDGVTVIDKDILIDIRLTLSNGEEENEGFYTIREAEEYLDSVAEYEE
jgi:hypothetical protein